ncbi:molybdopterin-guanine dinucleotide biosynthesis protein [Arthrobacter deserti]|uniref:Molybdopterin-guanine dinucleotide biosynthesis protein n=1 Tax=Arthrobacter deserti TaxID=1742687 RepID=A0ABX1JVR8_9MICC|nr:molybdopterin-guanine dinucleotide biosynthesis protein [Arthrobacter deserti]
MASAEEILHPFVTELLSALEIEDTPVDIGAVLGLAGVAAHGVVRPAAPLTTFVVGYAAGLAAATGQAAPEVAMRAASRVAEEVIRRHPAPGASAE